MRKEALTLTIILLMAPAALAVVSHQASQITPGTFGIGNYIFPNNLTINNNTIITGNVGIGTTNPSMPLVVVGSSNLATFKTLDVAATPVIYIGNSDFSHYGLIGVRGGALPFTGVLPGATAFGAASNDAVQFAANNDVKMTILNNGNVGIGTTSPSAPLDVNGRTNLRPTYVNLDGSTWYSLGWNTNQGAGGGTAIALCSNQYDDGAGTRSAVYILRAGYNGNNVEQGLLGQLNSGNAFTFRSNGGTLEVKGWDGLTGLSTSGRCQVISMGN